MPVPARPSATIRTVPSPPAAITRSTPAATASAVMLRPGSSSLVSNQSVCVQPADSRRWVRVSRKPSETFVGL